MNLNPPALGTNPSHTGRTDAACAPAAAFMTIDGLGAPDLFVLWALRQRRAEAGGCPRRVSTGFRRVLGDVHAARALAAFEAAYRVLADHGVRTLTLLPPACGLITCNEVRLLALCRATQASRTASARRQAGALVGPVWSPFLFASLERFTRALTRRSLRLSSTAAALRRSYH